MVGLFIRIFGLQTNSEVHSAKGTTGKISLGFKN